MARADTRGGGGGLSAVVDDPTPQLGGDLDADGHSITSLSLLNARDPDKLLYQKGDPSWANRTYTGYEIVNTAHTYTIGSTGDFANLKEAADVLQSIIITAHQTLQLQEDITEDPAGAAFKGIISSGGRLIIDLNGHTWTYASGSANFPLSFEGPMYVIIKNGTISYTVTNVKPPYDMITAKYGIVLQLNEDLTINANSNAYRSAVYVESQIGLWRHPTESGTENLTSVFYSQIGAQCGSYGTDPTSINVGQGGIYIKYDGTILS